MAGTSNESQSRDETLACFTSAITSILTDDGFSVLTAGAERCLDLAKKFNEILKNPTPALLSFAEKLICQFKDILDSRRSLKREKIWIDYHNLRCSEKFQQDWTEFSLATINLVSEPIFYQHCCQLMFESLIEKKLKAESFTNTAENEIVPRLTLDEENAVRYVAGYVVRKIRDSLPLPKDQAVCDILCQLIEPSETRVDMDAAGTS